MEKYLRFWRKLLRKKKEGVEQYLLRDGELEFILVVRSLRTCINISSTLEDIYFGKERAQEFETPEARRDEENHSR